MREQDEDIFLPQIYHGGYICCSWGVIRDFKRPYSPTFARLDRARQLPERRALSPV